MNVGYEDKDLKSYTEPEQDFNDPKRIGQTNAHAHITPANHQYVVHCV